MRTLVLSILMTLPLLAQPAVDLSVPGKLETATFGLG